MAKGTRYPRDPGADGDSPPAVGAPAAVGARGCWAAAMADRRRRGAPGAPHRAPGAAGARAAPGRARPGRDAPRALGGPLRPPAERSRSPTSSRLPPPSAPQSASTAAGAEPATQPRRTGLRVPLRRIHHPPSGLLLRRRTTTWRPAQTLQSYAAFTELHLAAQRLLVGVDDGLVPVAAGHAGVDLGRRGDPSLLAGEAEHLGAAAAGRTAGVHTALVSRRPPACVRSCS